MVKLALARACARRDGAPLPQLGDLRWNEDEFVAIAARQTAIEDAAARFGGPVLVCDTDAWATNVWHERYIGYESEPVKAIAAKLPRRALYLLTDHRGVPFEDDGLRDGLHLRNWMTERFRAQLAAAQLPWCELRGDAATRLNTALAEVDAVLARGWSFGPTPERGAT
jgi:nicotinamide riboside kinase